jgi:3',5'-cyclic-AMP phosphodiesterase
VLKNECPATGPHRQEIQHVRAQGLALCAAGLDWNDFIGMVDEEQLGWLGETLKPIGTTAPIVVMTRVPVVSAVMQIVPDPWKTPQTYMVQNSIDMLKILAPYNVKVVLQGHTHIREEVIYNGCRFITSGAVCGTGGRVRG